MKRKLAGIIADHISNGNEQFEDASSERQEVYLATAYAVLEGLRDPGEGGDWPRYSAGEWSRRNVEALIDDLLGKPSRS